MNYRGRGGFRPPFHGPGPRGPGPPPRFMGGPRPLFRDGPPFFDGPPRPRPPMFHPRHDDFDGPGDYDDFHRNGPSPPHHHFNGPGTEGDFDEFPPYFEEEMCNSFNPDVVMRDPYGGDFPPPPPRRRLPPPRSQARREDRVLRNPHPHTKIPEPPPKQPPKVNKVQPLMDIVMTPPVGISTPVRDSVKLERHVSSPVARVGPTVEVKSTSQIRSIIQPAKLATPTPPVVSPIKFATPVVAPPRFATPVIAPPRLATPVVAPPRLATPSIPVPPPTKLNTPPPPKPTTSSQSSTINSAMSAAAVPKLTLPKKDEHHPIAEKAKESKPPPVVSGKITQIHNSSGVVDYKIFFDASTMVGPMPSVGASVVVEVERVTGMPFKLIGRRVQILSTIEQVLESGDEEEVVPPTNDAALEEEYTKFLKDSNLTTTTNATDGPVISPTLAATTPAGGIAKTPVDEAEIERLAVFRSHLALQHRTLQFNLENADRLKRGLPPLPKPKEKKPKRLERDIVRTLEHNKASLLNSLKVNKPQ